MAEMRKEEILGRDAPGHSPVRPSQEGSGSKTRTDDVKVWLVSANGLDLNGKPCFWAAVINARSADEAMGRFIGLAEGSPDSNTIKAREQPHVAPRTP